MRLASVSAVLVLAAAVLGAVSFFQGGAQAAPPPGGAELYLTSPQAVAAVGGTVTVTVGVDFDAAAAPWQAVQHKIAYDDSILSTSAEPPGLPPPATVGPIQRAVGAPGVCTAESVGTVPNDHVLVGCLDTGGPLQTYEGDLWDITFTCILAGTSPMLLDITDVPIKTFANDGSADFPATYVDPVPPSITCVDVADIEANKTGPATVNAGGAIQYIVTGTNNGPQPWLGGIVADDLPDNADVSGCTPGPATACASVDIDVDGVPGNEVVGAPSCVFFAAFPNPFPVPPPIVTNLVICPASLAGVVAIAPGGSMTVTINVAAPAASCNDTLIDLGIAVADSATAPNFGVPGTNLDPDFLDGVDGSENNFAPFVTQVNDCQLTIAKTAPIGGGTGDAGSYTLTVTNTGTSQATSVVITDTVPAGLTVTSATPAGPPANCGNVGNVVTCNPGTIAGGGVVVITINFTMDTPGTYCNTANGTWVRVGGGAAASNEACFTVLPPFNGLVKAVDLNGDTDTADPGETPAEGEDTIQVNLWLCVDQATDDIDNDGNSTADDEPATCDGPGEGTLTIAEQIFTREDCDTRNDDDDGDGEPVSNVEFLGPGLPLIDDDGDTVVDEPGEQIPNPDFRAECPQPTLQDFIDDIDGDGNGNVDKDGGEEPEGLGAFEFQLKFDHKIFDITITPGTDWLPAGRTANCTMTIITENDIRFGCVSTSGLPIVLGFPQVSGAIGATITVSPEADLIFRIRPTKDNGVVRRLLDENCEVADIFGDIFPLTNAGLTEDCTDIDITIRRLEGDVDTDCDVDVNDAQRIAFRYGSFFGHLVYDQNYDLEPWPTADFDIDIKDLQFVFGRDGSTCEDPIPDNQHPLEATGVGQP